MKGIQERLEQDLAAVVSRLRRMDSVAALEELPAPAAAEGDEFDGAQESERREIGFATRDLLVERALRLKAALDRLREGDYGLCVECGERIPAARLRALPEVQTCVRCQDRIEREGRRLAPVGAEDYGAEDDD